MMHQVLGTSPFPRVYHTTRGYVLEGRDLGEKSRVLFSFVYRFAGLSVQLFGGLVDIHDCAERVTTLFLMVVRLLRSVKSFRGTIATMMIYTFCVSHD